MNERAGDDKCVRDNISRQLYAENQHRLYISTERSEHDIHMTEIHSVISKKAYICSIPT